MRYIYLFLAVFFIKLAYTQSPQSFKYQTTVRDNSGNLLSNKLVAFRVSLLQGSASGSITYAERHSIATNDFGIANFNVGQGSVLQGIFSTINWGNGPYFLKIELDLNNGTNYAFMGSSQLLSVPFAMYAANSGNATDDKDKDSTNEIQSLSITGSKLNLSKSNSITIDTDTTNEIQQLSLQSNQLSLSKNGGVINLTPYMDNIDSQQLSLTGNTLSITKGNSVYLNDVDSTNELQKLTLTGDSLMLSNNGGIVDLKKYATDTQTLSLQGTTLSISRGNSIQLNGAVDLDYDPTNEIQVLTHQNDTLKLSINGGAFLIPSNESVQSGKLNYGTATGSNIINITMPGYISSYKAGMPVIFKASQTNTGHVSVNINGIGIRSLFKNVSDTLVAGDIRANQMVSIIYDGSNFQFVATPFAKLSSSANALSNDFIGGLVPKGTEISSDSIKSLPGYQLKEVLSTSAFVYNFYQTNTTPLALYDDFIYMNGNRRLNIHTKKLDTINAFAFHQRTSVKDGNIIYGIPLNLGLGNLNIQKYFIDSNIIQSSTQTVSTGLSTINHFKFVQTDTFIYILRQNTTAFYVYNKYSDNLISSFTVNTGSIINNGLIIHKGKAVTVAWINPSYQICIWNSPTSVTCLPSISNPISTELYSDGESIVFGRYKYNETSNQWVLQDIPGLEPGHSYAFDHQGIAYYFNMPSGSIQYLYARYPDNTYKHIYSTDGTQRFSFVSDNYGIVYLNNDSLGNYYFKAGSNSSVIQQLILPKTKYIYIKK
jgi:hypothetical protein